MDCKVLIVDDETRYCELLRRVLERDGFTVGVADQGAAAMERLLHERVDLLITDLDMPGLTGLDLTELAQRLPRTPRVLVITAQKAMLEGAARRLRDAQCLLKPFSLEDFRAKVALLTGQWREATRDAGPRTQD